MIVTAIDMFGQVLCLEQVIYEICEVILDIFSCTVMLTPCVRHVVGNFLADMQAALHQVDCTVRLSTNHRCKSQLIVDNSMRISTRQCPVIDHARYFSQITIAENTDNSRRLASWRC